MNVVVIGGTGTLGRLVTSELAARGHRVELVPRIEARDPAAIARRRAPVIVSCAGASVALALGRGWRGYRAVDVPIGLAAVEAARRTGARLVYAGVHHPPEMRRTPYIDAHERVIDAMADVDGCVVRATGFFSAFAAFVPLARRGWLLDVGDGQARTNPIDERDLATVVVDAALGTGPRELAVGGPEILRRRELLELVAGVAARRVRIVGVPVWLARLGAYGLRPFHPRIAQLASFACGLGAHDVIAPALGTRRLADYLTERARPRPRALSVATGS